MRLQILVSFEPMSDYLQDLMKNLNPSANRFAAADDDAVAVCPDETMVLHFVI